MRSNSMTALAGRAFHAKWLGFDLYDFTAILSLALCFLLVAKLPFAAKAFGDNDFHVEARALAAAVRGNGPWESVAVTKAPGPVLYYTVPYLCLKPDSSDRDYWRVAVLWTAFWMGAAMLLLRRAATRVGGDVAGVLAVVITLLNPFNVYYAFGINAENPAYVGVILMITAWFWAGDDSSSNRIPWLAPIILALGAVVLILSRPNSAIIIPLMLLCGVLLVRRGSRQSGYLLGRSLILVLVVLAAVQFIIFKLPGRPSATRQGSYLAHVLFHGSFQYRTETWDWRFWDDSNRAGSMDYSDWRRELSGLKQQAQKDGVPLAELQYRWIWNDFLAHPLVRLKIVAVRTLSLHVALVNSVSSGAFKLGPWKGPAAYWSLHIAINAISVLVLAGAMVFAWRERTRLLYLWPLWTPWVALLVFHAFFYAESRYMFPARPGLVVMAAALASGALGRLRRGDSTPRGEPNLGD